MKKFVFVIVSFIAIVMICAFTIVNMETPPHEFSQKDTRILVIMGGQPFIYNSENGELIHISQFSEKQWRDLLPAIPYTEVPELVKMVEGWENGNR